jgi:hypothetical protein
MPLLFDPLGKTEGQVFCVCPAVDKETFSAQFKEDNR